MGLYRGIVEVAKDLNLIGLVWTMRKILGVGVEVIFILTLTFLFDTLTFIVFFLLSIFINISLASKLKTQLFLQLKLNGV